MIEYIDINIIFSVIVICITQIFYALINEVALSGNFHSKNVFKRFFDNGISSVINLLSYLRLRSSSLVSIKTFFFGYFVSILSFVLIYLSLSGSNFWMDGKIWLYIAVFIVNLNFLIMFLGAQESTLSSDYSFLNFSLSIVIFVVHILITEIQGSQIYLRELSFISFLIGLYVIYDITKDFLIKYSSKVESVLILMFVASSTYSLTSFYNSYIDFNLIESFREENLIITLLVILLARYGIKINSKLRPSIKNKLILGTYFKGAILIAIIRVAMWYI